MIDYKLDTTTKPQMLNLNPECGRLNPLKTLQRSTSERSEAV